MPRVTSTPPDHFLVYRGYDEDDDRFDYDIEHPESCPTSTWYDGITHHDCEIARTESDVGCHAFSPGLEDVKPGRYPLGLVVDKFVFADGTEYEIWLGIAT